jgi:hypothetical protein
MAFRWKKFGQWVLLALGLIVLGTFLLMGVPGMFIYLVWQVLLNAIFTREVIAEPPVGGGAMWPLGLGVSFLTPVGLPLGYIVASLLPIASLQRLPFLRHRLTWLLLFAMLWSLLIVFWFSGSVWEVKKSLSYL